jgi:galactoside O-acetyltransferase
MHSLDHRARRRDLQHYKDKRRDWCNIVIRPVRICRGAWLGARTIVLKGVTIGEGAVIGAGSVVSRDVPPFTLAVGNPARIVRQLDRGGEAACVTP